MTPDSAPVEEDVRDDSEVPEEELTDQEKRKRLEENGPDPIPVPDPVSPTPLHKPDSMSLEQYQTMRAMGLAEDDASEYGPGNESYLGYPTQGNQDTSRTKAALIHKPESEETVERNPVSEDGRDDDSTEKDEFGFPK